MITTQEVQMLGTLIQRATINQIEAAWANSIMNRLLAEAAKAELEQKKMNETEEGTSPA